MYSLHPARAGITALALLVALATPAVAAGTSVTTLANGAELSVSLTAPATSLIPSGHTGVDVPVSGSASIGQGAPNVHWTYVIDVSTSTTYSSCQQGNILDCEKLAVKNLNAAIVADGSALDVGLSIFAGSAASADMTAAPGDQPITAAGDPGVVTVVDSVRELGIGQFTDHSVPDLTNFAAGLQAANTSVSASPAASKNVVFLSDGQSNLGGGDFDAALTALKNAGATIYAFAVGSGSSCLAGSDGTLQAMADVTGGSCTNVPDPATLPAIVQNVTATELSAVALTGATLDTVTHTPPVDGPATAAFTGTAADLPIGTHQVCAAATGLGPKSDPSSQQSVQDCRDIDVFAFTLTPSTATNELGVVHSHTVTASVTGPDGKLGGWPVAFQVTGANAGATGACAPASCETDATGVVTFTYDVPVASASLGVDTVTATVTVNQDSTSASVTKTWQDTTAPTATCQPGPNPDGRIPAAPGNGGTAQNADGYYTISAVDDVWVPADVRLFVKDDGSSHVFGPFADPTNIKWIQAKGATPSQTAGDGVVSWLLKGNGDAVVYAVDGSGNTSATVSCRVPPPPK